MKEVVPKKETFIELLIRKGFIEGEASPRKKGQRGVADNLAAPLAINQPLIDYILARLLLTPVDEVMEVIEDPKCPLIVRELYHLTTKLGAGNKSARDFILHASARYPILESLPDPQIDAPRMIVRIPDEEYSPEAVAAEQRKLKQEAHKKIYKAFDIEPEKSQISE